MTGEVREDDNDEDDENDDGGPPSARRTSVILRTINDDDIIIIVKIGRISSVPCSARWLGPGQGMQNLQRDIMDWKANGGTCSITTRLAGETWQRS